MELTEEQVRATLEAREPIFHRAALGTTRADFDGMMAAEFHEVGASGTRYSREFVLELLVARHARAHEDVWAVTEFAVHHVAAHVWMASYTLLQDGVRLTRRATLWRWRLERWEILYHQGTLVVEAAPSQCT